MILPQTFVAALAIAILSLVCWGSWVCTFKLAQKWRFELYYLDFAVGLLAGAVTLALTAGSTGFDGFSLADDLAHAGKQQMAWGIAAGVIFNLGNMLLLASASVAGISIAFPIAGGVALIESAIFGFWAKPAGNPVLLFGGCAAVAAAVVVNAIAYRHVGVLRHEKLAQEGKVSTLRVAPVKGIVLAAVGGLLLGIAPTLAHNCMAAEIGLGPYSTCVMVGLGVLFSTVVFSLFFMNLPVEGQPLEFPDFFRSTLGQHGMGFLGGVVVATALASGYLAATAGLDPVSYEPLQGSGARLAPAIVTAARHGGALLAALWGYAAWRELAQTDAKAKNLSAVMWALFAAGLGMVAASPHF